MGTWKVVDVAKLVHNAENPSKLLKNSLFNDLTNFVQLKNYEDLIHSTNVFNVTTTKSATMKQNANKVGALSTDIYKSLFVQAKNIGVEICSVAYQGLKLDRIYEQKRNASKAEKRQKKKKKKRKAEKRQRKNQREKETEE